MQPRLLFPSISFNSSVLDGVSLMYQRVQRIECSNPRPVLLLGPLVEVCKDVLVKESPAKFSRCPPGEAHTLLGNLPLGFFGLLMVTEHLLLKSQKL